MSKRPLSPEDRKAIIRALRAKYITSPRDKTLQESLEDLKERMEDDTIEGRGLVLTGESGAGKSKSLFRAFTRAFPGWNPKTPDPNCPLTSIKVESPCTMKTLGRDTLAKLGYPLAAERTEHRIWELVRERIALRNIRFLHFDEVQNIINRANVTEAARLRDTLKSFLNDVEQPVCLILSGLPTIKDFLELDRQESRRCTFVSYKPLTCTAAPKIYEALSQYAGEAGLEIEPELEHAIASRLLHAACYQFGLSFEIAVDAINIALKACDLTLSHLHFAGEYARRTECPAHENPFLVEKWWELDCSILTQKPDQVELEKEAEPPAPPRATGKIASANTTEGRSGF